MTPQTIIKTALLGFALSPITVLIIAIVSMQQNRRRVREMWGKGE